MKSDGERKKRYTSFMLTSGNKQKAKVSTRACLVIPCIISIVLLSCIILPVHAMRNPSAVYCSALGYEYITEKTPEGDWGYCVLPDGSKVGSWLFLQGKTALSDNYCSKQGLETKTITDRSRCIQFMTDECAVCLLANGTEIEVTELMGLSFNESICGDGTCGMPENNQTCPQDCPSGDIDEYCDGLSDKICDPDCGPGEDIDCVSSEKTVPPATTTTKAPLNSGVVIGGLLAVVIFLRLHEKH